MNETKRIIVFAPHPDDETWGCGGTIAKKVREGYEVFIVVLTDGRHAFSAVLGIHSDPTPLELREIRRKEVERATKILGVEKKNLLFLDFEDGTLEEKEEDVEEKVIEILSKIHPAEVFFPYEKDCHPDHRATNYIVRNAIRKLGLHSVNYSYSIVRINARVGPIIDAIKNLFKRNMMCVDISSFRSLKNAAINEFKSEVSIISHRQKVPIVRELRKIVKNEEKFFIYKPDVQKLVSDD